MTTMVAVKIGATCGIIYLYFLFWLEIIYKLVVIMVEREMLSARLVKLVRIRHSDNRLHRNQGDHQVCNGVTDHHGSGCHLMVKGFE